MEDQPKHSEPTVAKKPNRKVLKYGLLVFVVFMLIKSCVLETYSVPTESMSATVTPGDFIVASKTRYGFRIPRTPLSLPFFGKQFPAWMPLIGGNRTYVEKAQLPYMKMPALQKIKRNHIVIFHSPVADTVTTEYGSTYTYYELLRQAEQNGKHNPKAAVQETFNIEYYPVDKRDAWVKRCIAIAGDTLEIVKGDCYVNGVMVDTVPGLQYEYYIELNDSNNIIGPWLAKKGITGFQVYTHLPNTAMMNISTAFAEELAENDTVQLIERNLHNDPMNFLSTEVTMFPHDKRFKWNIDNYGPIVIPKKGMTVELTSENLALYSRCITTYEGNDLPKPSSSATPPTYTFEMDYYWMMGDNRYRSQDSRFWGFVPEDHVDAKVLFE